MFGPSNAMARPRRSPTFGPQSLNCIGSSPAFARQCTRWRSWTIRTADSPRGWSTPGARCVCRPPPSGPRRRTLRALCLAHLGRMKEAYDWLEKAAQEGKLENLWADLIWDHKDERFRKVARMVGLDP